MMVVYIIIYRHAWTQLPAEVVIRLTCHWVACYCFEAQQVAHCMGSVVVRCGDTCTRETFTIIIKRPIILLP